jgi:hypothetical protein
MGLDMFLTANRYLMSYSEEDAGLANRIAKHFPEIANIHTANSRFVPEVKEISFRVGYWRKANAIHDWFVKNVQNGTDDCGKYEVSREQLQELLDLCLQVLRDTTKAAGLLPTRGGFFFGSTEYNHYYFEDLELTVDILKNALALPERWDFYYQSSW